MTKDIDKLYIQTEEAILNNAIKNSFEMLKGRAIEISNISIKQELSNQEDIYNQMLLFTFKNAEDPHRAEILAKLKKRLLEINDQLKEKVILSDSTNTIRNEKIYFERFATTFLGKTFNNFGQTGK